MNVKISSSQAVILLFLCRMFATVTYSPMNGENADVTAILLGDFLATFATGIVMIPLFLYFKKRNVQNLLDECYRISKGFGIAVGIYCFLMVFLVLVDTVSHFENFMTNAIFPDTSSAIIIITFLIACCYGAWMGLEGIARASSIIFVFFLVSLCFIFTAAWSSIEWVNLQPLTRDHPVRQVLQSMLENISLNTEFIILVFIYPKIKGSFFNISIWYLIISGIILSAVGITTVLILGQFTLKQVFPFYTIASIIETKIVQRFDAVHMALWVLVSYVRVTVYLIVAGKLLPRIFSPRLEKWVFIPITVCIGLGAYGVSLQVGPQSMVHRFLTMTALVLIIMVIIPILLFIFGKKQNHQTSNGK